MAWLFAATIVLPSLVLAVIAYGAIKAERHLAEQRWRERLVDASNRTYRQLELRVQAAQARSEALGRAGGPSASPNGGILEAVWEKELRLKPATLVAWIPDGRADPGPAMPSELEEADTKSDQAQGQQEVEAYRSLLGHLNSPWEGLVRLRLARALARANHQEAAKVQLRVAAALPDSPGPLNTAFVAKFELAAGNPPASAALYRDLAAGRWLLEKSSYAFYELQLRVTAGDLLSPEQIRAEGRRQALARNLERAIEGGRGWMRDDGGAAWVAGPPAAAVFVPEDQWRRWLKDSSRLVPGDVAIRVGPSPGGRGSPNQSVSLASLGVPWEIWAEPLDPRALELENKRRQGLLTVVLVVAAGVLLFGSLATYRLVSRELRMARMEADFAAAVSHEFRSPLTGIRHLGEMLLAGRAAHDEERRRHYYSLICQEIDRLTRLVENVLDFARIEKGRKQYRKERIETVEWLTEIVGIASTRRAVKLAAAPVLSAVEGDRDALSSAVMNLIDNAIKYSPADAPVEVCATMEHGWVTLAVRDQGCGIAPEEQRFVFDRFYRGTPLHGRPPRGAGFGLALVRKIANAHGARLSLESKPGEGSTFYLALRIFA